MCFSFTVLGNKIRLVHQSSSSLFNNTERPETRPAHWWRLQWTCWCRHRGEEEGSSRVGVQGRNVESQSVEKNDGVAVVNTVLQKRRQQRRVCESGAHKRTCTWDVSEVDMVTEGVPSQSCSITSTHSTVTRTAHWQLWHLLGIPSLSQFTCNGENQLMGTCPPQH